MKSGGEYSNDIQRFIREKERILARKIKAAQLSLYAQLLELVVDMNTDDTGNIRFSSGNLRKGEKVSLIISTFNKTKNTGIGKWLINRFLDLFGLNRLYFKTLEPLKTQKVEDKARKLIMRRLGYDLDKKIIIPNGYVNKIVNSEAVAIQIIERINQAVAAKMPIKKFREQLKDDFTNPNKLGLLERDYQTKTNDIFHQVSRQTKLTFADELGLNYAVYRGTAKNNTRPFCLERMGKVFTREEIQAWENLQFKGKPSAGYNPFVDLGGYNCRHTLNWISDEMAFRRRPELKKND